MVIASWWKVCIFGDKWARNRSRIMQKPPEDVVKRIFDDLSRFRADKVGIHFDREDLLHEAASRLRQQDWNPDDAHAQNRRRRIFLNLRKKLQKRERVRQRVYATWREGHLIQQRQLIREPAIPERDLEKEDLGRCIKRSIALLPPAEREVVDRLIFKTQSYDVVAKEMGLSKTSVQRLRSQALDRLRPGLSELWFD